MNSPMLELLKKSNRKSPLLRIVGALFVLLLAGVVYAWVYLAGETAHPERTGVVRVTVPQGASAWRVGYMLRDSSLIASPRRFAWHLKFRGVSQQLKAGVYDVERSLSMRQMADRFLTGDEVEVEVTFPEGWTSRQMAARLDSLEICDEAEFLAAVKEHPLIDELKLPTRTMEGFLFPETYKVRLNRPANELVSTMFALFREKVGEGWMKRARENSYGLQGVVTLASIVQGEYQLAGEAPDIAAVYNNRLKRGMLLQADPTIQYLLPEGPRRLTYRDLRIDNPYNTYKYAGLPPGPINNPALDALKAALDPPEKPWLYMVARGDGGHTFTTNFQDHLNAKKRLDAIRRAEARRRRQAGQ